MSSDKDKRFHATDRATGDSVDETAEKNMPTTPTAAKGDRIGERATASDTAPDRETASDTAPDRDTESEMTHLPAPSSAPLDPEKLHILLTYSTLLALTRHPSQPVADLNMEAQVRQLDAFLAGDVTEDGVATHWSAESERPERIQRYKDLCDQLVPNLTAAIKKQSQANLNAQPKNRVHGDKNPEHKAFWQLFLAPSLVTMYGAWVEKSSKKGINPDVDPWTDVAKFGKVILLFESIYALQYDFDDWEHTAPRPVFNQTPRLDAEEFMRVMDNRDQIRVHHRVATPLGKVFSQLTVIPETAIKYTEKELTSMWRDKTRPKYLLPDPVAVTIPPKKKDTLWVNADGVGKLWTRGEASWEPSFTFMVFDTATDAYIHEYLVDPTFLDQIDLDNDTWVVKYRKKISQWRGRTTGEATKIRDHWTDDERAAVYKFVNAWVKKNGVDKFLTRLLEGEKDNLVAALTAKTGHARSSESVSAWMRQQMTAKPNEPLGMLHVKGQNVAGRMAAGEDIADDERYPDEAIDVADFLAKSKLKTPSKSSKYSLKRKLDSDDESATDGDSGNQDSVSPSSSPRKSDRRSKLTVKGKKLLGRGMDEQDAPSVEPKPLTKAEMDARNAQHAAEEADADLTHEVEMIFELDDNNDNDELIEDD